jgi:competence protein ComEC
MSPGLKRLRDDIEKHHVPIVALRAADTLQTHAPNVRLSILHPPRGGVLGNDNANSLVLLMEYETRRILLAGDLEERGLQDLLAEEPIPCDVVLAPHHGSTRSNPTGFALWCRPRFVVVSGQRDYDPGRAVHPVEQAFRARGAQVFHTSTHGCVQFQISRQEIVARTHRRPKEEQ